MVDRACRDDFFKRYPDAGPLLTTWRMRPKKGTEGTPEDPRVLAAAALCTALQRDNDIRKRFAMNGGLSGLAQMHIRSDVALAGTGNIPVDTFPPAPPLPLEKTTVLNNSSSTDDF